MSSVSTTYWVRRDTLARLGRAAARGAGVVWPWTLAKLGARRPLTLRCEWLGGPTDRWRIEARGGRWIAEGDQPFGEVQRWIRRHEGYV